MTPCHSTQYPATMNRYTTPCENFHYPEGGRSEMAACLEMGHTLVQNNLAAPVCVCKVLSLKFSVSKKQAACFSAAQHGGNGWSMASFCVCKPICPLSVTVFLV